MLDGRMGLNLLNLALQGQKHHQSVAASRARLRAVEEKHENLLREGSPELQVAGLEYASAAHEYLNAVMTWLSWIDRQTESRDSSERKSSGQSNGK
jgi:hypothetical protein